MNPLRPFRISVYNAVAQMEIGDYVANQIPAKGDLISFFPIRLPDDDPFRLWCMWRVESVMWTVASPGSITAGQHARETGLHDAVGYCADVEVHVWPASGPHFYQTPAWAKPFRAPDEDEEPAP